MDHNPSSGISHGYSRSSDELESGSSVRYHCPAKHVGQCNGSFRRPGDWHPVIQEFRRLIEETPEIYIGFHDMFTQIPPEYVNDPTGAPQVKDYMTMLHSFDRTLHEAPEWHYDPQDPVASEMASFPIATILEWPMGTPAGYAMFTHPLVNAQFKRLFSVWSEFLCSYESTSVLTTAPNGWFSPSAMEVMPDFAGDFICDPNDPSGHYGFQSWDDYFTRQFRPGKREIPEGLMVDDAVVHSSCESAVYRVAFNVQARDTFWVKGQPYSVLHMLNHDALAPQFAGGTVYQAFLSPTSYHRWHSPVNGVVVKVVHVQGTYFAEAPTEGFRASPYDAAIQGADPVGPNRSQSFLTAVATRCLVFIRANDPRIGLMCFIAVGMVEVSTCEVTVKHGDVVKKGEELGMFHFGGSTYCLVFRPSTKLLFEKGLIPSPSNPDPNVKVNAPIARVVD